MDADGAARCGLPAEVEYEYTMSSTDGTLDSAKLRCPRGHWFNGPIAALTLDTGLDTDQGKGRDTGAAREAGIRASRGRI